MDVLEGIATQVSRGACSVRNRFMSSGDIRKVAGYPPALLVCLGAVAALGLAGCQTAAYKKGDAAARAAQAASAQIQAVSTNLEATTGALNDLVNQPAEDAKPQFRRFSDALDRLLASAKRADADVARLGRENTAYMQAWDKEIASIQDQDIRNRSETRKAEVGAQVISADRQYNEAWNDRQPVLGYLQDIRKALSTDLTRSGLMAVQPWVVKVNENARTVQTALAQSGTEMDTLAARLSSARVQEAK